MSLNIELIGKGAPVVFLHGFLESNSMWKYFDLKSLNKLCVLVDIPGHGISPFPEKLNSIKNVAFYIYEQLNFFGFKTYDIIGHSLGGYVGAELHKLLSDKQKLIFYHSNFWTDSERKKLDRERVISIVKSDKSSFIRGAIPNLFTTDCRNSKTVQDLIVEASSISNDTIAFYSKFMKERENNLDYIEKRKDIYFIQGEKDHIVPLNSEFEKIFPDINYYLINSGHMSYIENQVAATKVIKKIFFHQLNSVVKR